MFVKCRRRDSQQCTENPQLSNRLLPKEKLPKIRIEGCNKKRRLGTKSLRTKPVRQKKLRRTATANTPTTTVFDKLFVQTATSKVGTNAMALSQLSVTNGPSGFNSD